MFNANILCNLLTAGFGSSIDTSMADVTWGVDDATTVSVVTLALTTCDGVFMAVIVDALLGDATTNV